MGIHNVCFSGYILLKSDRNADLVQSFIESVAY